MELEERFLSYVRKTSTCWFWIGGLDKDGYGITSIKHKPKKAHRLSYELYKGEYPDGFVTDHLCKVRNCVNPDHLEAVTRVENLIRKTKTHCKYGHKLTLVKSKYHKKKCYECNRGWQQKYYWQKKEVLNALSNQ